MAFFPPPSAKHSIGSSLSPNGYQDCLFLVHADRYLYCHGELTLLDNGCRFDCVSTSIETPRLCVRFISLGLADSVSKECRLEGVNTFGTSCGEDVSIGKRRGHCPLGITS